MVIVRALLAFAITLVRSRVSLQLELVALWLHLTLDERSSRRPRERSGDRSFWAWLARQWARW